MFFFQILTSSERVLRGSDETNITMTLTIPFGCALISQCPLYVSTFFPSDIVKEDFCWILIGLSEGCDTYFDNREVVPLSRTVTVRGVTNTLTECFVKEFGVTLRTNYNQLKGFMLNAFLGFLWVSQINMVIFSKRIIHVKQ